MQSQALAVKNNFYSNEKLVSILVENPQLIERPIVINHKKAIIGRPPGNILSII